MMTSLPFMYSSWIIASMSAVVMVRDGRYLKTKRQVSEENARSMSRTICSMSAPRRSTLEPRPKEIIRSMVSNRSFSCVRKSTAGLRVGSLVMYSGLNRESVAQNATEHSMPDFQSPERPKWTYTRDPSYPPPSISLNIRIPVRTVDCGLLRAA